MLRGPAELGELTYPVRDSAVGRIARVAREGLGLFQTIYKYNVSPTHQILYGSKDVFNIVSFGVEPKIINTPLSRFAEGDLF